MVQVIRGVQVVVRPLPLAIDPRESAVIVVDMQQGFSGSGGSWDRAGIDESGMQSIVAPIARVLTAARHVGMPIVYLTMEFEGAGEDKDGRLWNDERSVR